MSSSTADVLVVGAGPTGLTLALQAADHGAAVRIVERRDEPFRPSRALIVHPRTLEALRPLGVTDAMLDRGDVAPSVHLHLRSGTVRARLERFDLPDTAFPHLLLIRQADVEAVLAAALESRGVTVERSLEITGVAARPDAAIATTAGGGPGELECRFLVGCDGPDSITRRSPGVAWSGGPYRQEVVLADLELTGDLTSGAAHAAPGPLGVVFLFPLGERATWRLLATRPSVTPDLAFGQPGPPVAEEDVRGLLEGSGLQATISEVRWSARVPLQHRIAGAYRHGSVFLAGDAAHSHSPAGGQGMNTGIQDAANLGWKLAYAARSTHPATTATLLDSYEIERRPVARQVLAMTHAVFWAEASIDPFAKLVRSAVAIAGGPLLPYLLRRRRMLAIGARTLGQLRVHYRRSPISYNGDHRPRTLPRAGHRIADGAVSTPSGPARLQGLLAHPGIHMLLQRDASAPEALERQVRTHRLIDHAGTGVVAVRPDGYVGFAADAAEADQLRSWLELVHAPPTPPTRPGDAGRACRDA